MRTDFRGLTSWLKNSFIDYPGTVATVLFFSGCNLRCPYCHNGSLITSPEDLSHMSDTIWDFLEQRKTTMEGAVFSGGEPTLHPHLVENIKEIRSLGYRIKLDSNGLRPKIIQSFSPDYLALDIKTRPDLYPVLLKASHKEIKERLEQSIALVKKMGANAEIRITVAPKVITTSIIESCAHLIEGVERVYLQPANLRKELLDPNFFKDLSPLPSEEIKRFQEIITPYVGSCHIRNG